MRLWHYYLLPYLPRQQLLGQHREVCALRGLGWGKKHSTVDYVWNYPYEYLYQYHLKVMAEMRVRGYRPDTKWEEYNYRGKKAEPLSGFANIEGTPNYPEHNKEYLESCIINLRNKIGSNANGKYNDADITRFFSFLED